MGANLRLRERLSQEAQQRGYSVRYPRLEFCTDNGAMIAFAGAMRLKAMQIEKQDYAFSVRPRWDLADLQAP